MRKFLSIVIPRYRETEREIFPLLSSISSQVGIDFNDIEVLITTDGGGGKPLDENFLALFGFDVKQLWLEKNSGCGVARQAAMDIAKGDYILCCDADDVLHNVGALAALTQEAEATAPDILTSEFLEEKLGQDGRYYYITHSGPVGCWMHGKLLRRGFLTQNNIRFHDEIQYHEDSYFLCIAMALAERMRHLPTISYVWKHNPNSITRKDGAIYTFRSVPGYIKAIAMAWETVERLRPEQMYDKVPQFVHYNYFMMHRADWQEPERKELLEKAEEAFAQSVKPWLHYYWEASPELAAESYNTERGRVFQGGVETETVAAWIKRLGLTQNKA